MNRKWPCTQSMCLFPNREYGGFAHLTELSSREYEWADQDTGTHQALLFLSTGPAPQTYISLLCFVASLNLRIKDLQDLRAGKDHSCSRKCWPEPRGKCGMGGGHLVT